MNPAIIENDATMHYEVRMMNGDTYKTADGPETWDGVRLSDRKRLLILDLIAIRDMRDPDHRIYLNPDLIASIRPIPIYDMIAADRDEDKRKEITEIAGSTIGALFGRKPIA